MFLPGTEVFLAPLLCWLLELPRVRQLWPWLRGSVQLALVMVPLAIVVVQTLPKPRPETPNSAGAPEPTRDDYLQFVPSK